MVDICRYGRSRSSSRVGQTRFEKNCAHSAGVNPRVSLDRAIKGKAKSEHDDH